MKDSQEHGVGFSERLEHFLQDIIANANADHSQPVMADWKNIERLLGKPHTPELEQAITEASRKIDETIHIGHAPKGLVVLTQQWRDGTPELVMNETETATGITVQEPYLKFKGDWYVNGLIPVGKPSAVVGGPKSGKTLIGTELAAALSSGTDFIRDRDFRTERGQRVLYINTDLKPQAMSERMKKSCDYVQGTFRDPKKLGLVHTVGLDEEGMVNEIETYIEDINPTVIIVDNASTAFWNLFPLKLPCKHTPTIVYLVQSEEQLKGQVDVIHKVMKHSDGVVFQAHGVDEGGGILIEL